ncbi:MAG: NAD(P)/FAD-dependent oxidoreductase, partial [Pseudomonadales bacterium]
RTLAALQPDVNITLVEPAKTYSACPLSNLVIAGERPLAAQQFRYQALAAAGITVAHTTATDINPATRVVALATGQRLPYDRLVVAPGIAMRWDALPGYDRAAAATMPHAWQAGSQTTLLRTQLRDMDDGGLVLISVPDNPYRCPPGPYERASLIAHYLQQHKPRSKLLILDAKDQFSKQSLFQRAWAQHYGELVEWQGAADGARVVSVNAASGTVNTDFDTFKPTVANIIPPQQAGEIAQRAGLADASGWCPIRAVDFESTLQPGVHVIGDAAIANAMPKSAFAANAQARLCAAQISRGLNDMAPLPTTLLNTCYSLVAPEHGISVAGAYRPAGERWQPVPGAGGTSDPAASQRHRNLEAQYAKDWFNVLTEQIWR